MSMSFVAVFCLLITALTSVNADFYGNCDVLKCIEPFKDIQQHTGSFNFAAFQQGCSLYPSAMKCVESTTKGCSVSKVDQALWRALKEDMDYVCIDKRSDYLEVAPCLQRQDIVISMKGCAETIKEHAQSTSQSQICSLADEALSCMRQAARPCGEKAETISYTLTRQTLNRVLESLGKTCFLGNEGKSQEEKPAELPCFDAIQGIEVAHGSYFSPHKRDPCYSCMCDKGFPTMCLSSSCAPPSCTNWRAVEGKCCEFVCPGALLTETWGRKTHFGGTVDTKVRLGLIIGGCVLGFAILIAVIVLVKKRRNKHQVIKRAGLIIGEHPPAYEDAYPAYNPYTEKSAGGNPTVQY